MLLWFNFQGRIRSNFSTRRSKVRKKDSYFLVIIRNNAFHLTRAEVLNGSDYSQFCNLRLRSRLCLVLLQSVSKTIDNWQKVGSLSLLDWQWSAERSEQRSDNKYNNAFFSFYKKEECNFRFATYATIGKVSRHVVH